MPWISYHVVLHKAFQMYSTSHGLHTCCLPSSMQQLYIPSKQQLPRQGSGCCLHANILTRQSRAQTAAIRLITRMVTTTATTCAVIACMVGSHSEKGAQQQQQQGQQQHCTITKPSAYPTHVTQGPAVIHAGPPCMQLPVSAAAWCSARQFAMCYYLIMTRAYCSTSLLSTNCYCYCYMVQDLA